MWVEELTHGIGVMKTYKLTYESVEVMHALFDKNTAHNRWSIKSVYLREVTEYFGTRTEQLDLYFEDQQVTFTSFTEKIVNANKGKSLLNFSPISVLTC
jgi:cell cycle checkpoint control protein RAD9A